MSSRSSRSSKSKRSMTLVPIGEIDRIVWLNKCNKYEDCDDFIFYTKNGKVLGKYIDHSKLFARFENGSIQHNMPIYYIYTTSGGYNKQSKSKRAKTTRKSKRKSRRI